MLENINTIKEKAKNNFEKIDEAIKFIDIYQKNFSDSSSIIRALEGVSDELKDLKVSVEKLYNECEEKINMVGTDAEIKEYYVHSVLNFDVDKGISGCLMDANRGRALFLLDRTIDPSGKVGYVYDASPTESKYMGAFKSLVTAFLGRYGYDLIEPQLGVSLNRDYFNYNLMQRGGDNSPNAKNVEIYSATPGVYNVSTGEVLKKAKVCLREATKVNSDDDDDQDSL